jgi:hypothetical protein
VREVVAPVNARRQQPYLLYLQGEQCGQQQLISAFIGPSACTCIMRAVLLWIWCCAARYSSAAYNGAATDGVSAICRWSMQAT